MSVTVLENDQTSYLAPGKLFIKRGEKYRKSYISRMKLKLLDKVDEIYKHGILMFVATTAANVCNYLFHLVMGRMLGPADYGALASLLSLYFIISTPAKDALRTVISKFVAVFKAHNELGKVRYLNHRAMQKLFMYGFLIFLAIGFGSGFIASFLKISSPVPVIILGGAVLASVVLPVGWGVLQGLQEFGQLGVSIFAEAALRLGSAVVLVWLGFRVNGAIGACALSNIIALSILFLPLAFLLKGEEKDAEINSGEIYKYFWPTLVTVLCFTALTQFDISLVKHFFLAKEAGYYSAAALMGRIVLFLPMAIAMVMFPKTSELHALKQDSSSVLWKSLMIVAGICGLITVFYFLFPRFMITVFFGAKFAAGAPLIGLFGAAMTLFAMANILMYYFLSIHQLKFIWILIPCTFFEIGAIWFFHNDLAQVVKILVLTSLLLLGSNIFVLIRILRTNKEIPATN